MAYQITVDDDKAATLVAFLKELLFVRIAEPESSKSAQGKDFDLTAPYFGAFPDWEFYDRKQDSAKRLEGWL